MRPLIFYLIIYPIKKISAKARLIKAPHTTSRIKCAPESTLVTSTKDEAKDIKIPYNGFMYIQAAAMTTALAECLLGNEHPGLLFDLMSGSVL